mmetsp:Transcript_53390/g.124277  ORF Transcript_53390/g.124277 Transcript_53390/m.124277 type:complete len:218 (+) Transcript_53390:89-742(+)
MRPAAGEPLCEIAQQQHAAAVSLGQRGHRACCERLAGAGNVRGRAAPSAQRVLEGQRDKSCNPGLEPLGLRVGEEELPRAVGTGDQRGPAHATDQPHLGHEVHVDGARVGVAGRLLRCSALGTTLCAKAATRACAGSTTISILDVPCNDAALCAVFGHGLGVARVRLLSHGLQFPPDGRDLRESGGHHCPERGAVARRERLPGHGLLLVLLHQEAHT